MEENSALIVDKKGLAKKLANKPKAFILYELLQNAWDEKVSEVSVDITPIPGRSEVRIFVQDDCPDGFQDLTSIYTLFKDSKKAPDPTKRGRFELGEKLVAAVAQRMEVVTTKGCVIIEGDKRIMLPKKKLQAGSCILVDVRMTRAEHVEMMHEAAMLIPPEGIRTVINGKLLTQRKPKCAFTTTLQTIFADSEGNLKPTRRKTEVCVYPVKDGETAHIYEMGIPVVPTGDRWHYDVQQRVPVNWERNNVPPSFLQKVRTAVLNEMHEELDGEEQATEAWVRAAAADPAALPEAVTKVMDERFGEKRVIVDPSDPEGTKIAMSKGYTIVYPGALSKGEWGNVRGSGAILPAGQVTPSPKPYDPNGTPERIIPREKWTADMHKIVELAEFLSSKLFGHQCTVRIVKEPNVSWGANYGPGSLALNYGRLGRNWFARHKWDEEVLDLLIHEFVHHTVSDHLSERFHKTATKLGAKCVGLALEYPREFGR